MIKFLHCADIHLGSALTSRLPADRAEERRREMRATFGRMADYAAANGCAAVLLCGDVFDGDRPFKRDKEYFYGVIKAHPDIQFYYLRGNHDCRQSYTEQLPNLKTFGGEWTYYDCGGVTIAGTELSPENCLSLYSSLSLDGRRVNIVMLHGQVAGSAGEGLINVNALRGRGIDYLALGHVHSFSGGRLDGRGVYAYSGCLEGRGYDEQGQKGFVMLEVDGGRVNSTFVPFASRTVSGCVCDISTCPDWASAMRAGMAAAPRSPGDMVRLTLVGEAHFDASTLAADLQKELEGRYFSASVVDETRPALALSSLARENTLRGAFVRAALASDYPEERKQGIIAAGLKALSGREDEL